MTWDAMLAREERANDPAWAFETWRDGRLYGHTKYIQNGRTAFAAGVAWVLARQREWENVPVREALHELRKGDASVFFPLFEHDPTLWADCPRDGRVTITKEGYCDRCLFDFDR